MIGALTVGQKAVKFGYKRYGVPGAIAAGGAVLVGYVAVRRALKTAADSDRINEVVDVETIQSAVEDDGIDAIGDPDVLSEAIEPEGQGSSIAMDDLESDGIDEFSPDDLQDDPDSSDD
ncbi:hypothetical protein CV102_21425 [Natronococcus pandeyae]|uniref:Uncharacterized protein n=1 Tax=Natronococcus pandeyae TaxID=2055836 RepID=A0A8J8Q3U3_9EURY|nr:hypothetical protein [Natronococcus pandeyae]TYL36615.1 hypothetical protein CV102_21425 [Natronococcus pandeyae]